MIKIEISLFVQLIDDENVKGVVSMNEDYELWFSNSAKVSNIFLYFI